MSGAIQCDVSGVAYCCSMTSQRILTAVLPPELNEKARLRVADESQAKSRVYLNPWLVTRDEEGQSLKLLNQSDDTNKFVQICFAGEASFYTSRPAVIPAGYALSFEVKRFLGESQRLGEPHEANEMPEAGELQATSESHEGGEAGFYVRWNNADGVSLIWPLVW